MRSALGALVAGALIALSGCGGDDDEKSGAKEDESQRPGQPQPPAQRELKTSGGILVIKKVEIGDRVPPGCEETDITCRQAEPGFQILQVTMASKEGGELSKVSDDLGNQPREAYITSSSGDKTKSFLTGYDQAGIKVGFTPADDERGFKLHWPGNPPVELGK